MVENSQFTSETRQTTHEPNHENDEPMTSFLWECIWQMVILLRKQDWSPLSRAMCFKTVMEKQ